MIIRMQACLTAAAIGLLLPTLSTGGPVGNPDNSFGSTEFEILDPATNPNQAPYFAAVAESLDAVTVGGRTVRRVSVDTLIAQAEPTIETAPKYEDAFEEPAPPANSDRTDLKPAGSAPTAGQCNCECNCQHRQAAKDKAATLKKAAAGSHKMLQYQNDFSYLSDPAYDGALLGDSFKRLKFGNFITYDIGGQFRSRYQHEQNIRGLGLTGRDDNFMLYRTRLYLNTEIGERVRVFAETLDANSNYEDFSARGIEENRWDVQNLFVDVKAFDNGKSKLVGRVGRQEVALGDERYVSPLDWANTRRTFDGGRVMLSDENWTVDGFWLRPLIPDVHNADETDDDADLYGIYLSNKNAPKGVFDAYWIAFDNDLIGFAFDSFGARYKGKWGDLLVDGEGAFQIGENADGSDHHAGFFTVGVGRQFDCLPKKPTAWLYLDWASGTGDNGAGKGHHHFLPLAHKYLGFMDLFGRRNIIDLNWLTTTPINDKLKLLTWMHSFWLQDHDDTPYSVVMTPFAPGIVGDERYLGTELDVILARSLTPRSNVLLGLSYFWAGGYYDTPGLPTNKDGSFLYTQYTLNF